MTRTLLLIPAIVLTCALSGAAQEATPPEPTHEQFTIAAEPGPLTFVADSVGRFLGDGNGEDKTGFYPALGRIVSGAGWISIGPGYRQRLFGNRAVLDGSAAVSWRAYKQGQTIRIHRSRREPCRYRHAGGMAGSAEFIESRRPSSSAVLAVSLADDQGDIMNIHSFT